MRVMMTVEELRQLVELKRDVARKVRNVRLDEDGHLEVELRVKERLSPVRLIVRKDWVEGRQWNVRMRVRTFSRWDVPGWLVPTVLKALEAMGVLALPQGLVSFRPAGSAEIVAVLDLDCLSALISATVDKTIGVNSARFADGLEVDLVVSDWSSNKSTPVRSAEESRVRS